MTMHPLIADPQIAQVRKRKSEGDCPITEPLSVESLEDLVLDLADETQGRNKINGHAFAAVLDLVTKADLLLEATFDGGTEKQIVSTDAWLQLSQAVLRLKNLIPHDERPAEAPHAVRLFWPEESRSDGRPARPQRIPSDQPERSASSGPINPV